MIWLRDNAAKRNIRRHRAHWAVVLGCIGLFVLHTVLNRAFRSVFRFVSDYISDKFCIVCTHTALFYQIIFQIIFTSLVPGLRMCRRSWAAERSLPWYHSCRLKSIMLQVRCSAEYSVFCFVFAVTSRWQQRVWIVRWSNLPLHTSIISGDMYTSALISNPVSSNLFQPSRS